MKKRNLLYYLTGKIKFKWKHKGRKIKVNEKERSNYVNNKGKWLELKALKSGEVRNKVKEEARKYGRL